ncbi:MAG: hypothetical protein U5K72_18855 [Balneolaceae bacterium]|nr:hypothetical protein [Balneolaceae bacterium]
MGQFINNVTDDPEAPWSYDAFEPPPGFVMPENPANTDQNRERERIGW